MNYEVLNTLWMEKYRPNSLDTIVLNDNTRSQIEKFVSEGIIPNIFLCSRPGQGKTSLAKLLAYHIFETDTLYVNCSDENNVDTVRTKITNFANTLSSDGNFKIVILDEADGFANVQSQKILRVLMEEVSDNTRFIITANYRDRIIEAVRSRCLELDITPTIKDVGKRVLDILKTENIKVTKTEKENLCNLIRHYFPDIRSILKHVQACINKDGELVVGDLGASSEFLEEIYTKIKAGKEQAQSLREMLIKSENIFGHDYARLLVDFYRKIITKSDLTDSQKSKWVINLSEYAYRSATVVDQELNATACFISLME